MKTYEVLIYESEEDFNRSQLATLPQIEGMTRKREAMREGRLWLAEAPIVKVQSSDREFIQILRRKA
ncbi:MAG: hypothetical protein EOS58_32395 [Mesorhizobium sp.]|nr:MAG: hypothetical protein EOS58_32395 [Mesorhizobium sp.]